MRHDVLSVLTARMLGVPYADDADELRRFEQDLPELAGQPFAYGTVQATLLTLAAAYTEPECEQAMLPLIPALAANDSNLWRASCVAERRGLHRMARKMRLIYILRRLGI